MSKGSQRGRYFGSRKLKPIGATKVSRKLPAIDPKRSAAAAWEWLERFDSLPNQVKPIK